MDILYFFCWKDLPKSPPDIVLAIIFMSSKKT